MPNAAGCARVTPEACFQQNTFTIRACWSGLLAGSAGAPETPGPCGPSATPACPPASREQTAWTDATRARQIACASFVSLRGRSAATVLFAIGLAALRIALHGAGPHQPDIMPEPGQRARPVLRVGTGFDTDQTGGRRGRNPGIRLHLRLDRLAPAAQRRAEILLLAIWPAAAAAAA
jgi:hypothetical protein